MSTLLPRFLPHGHEGPGAGAGAFPAPESPGSQPDSVDRLAHDARNVISGLMLYCELLAAPGALSKSHTHYAHDLETIVRSAAQIIERMAAAQKSNSSPDRPAAGPVPLPSLPVTDIADELRRLQPLLAAIAGPGVRLTIAAMPCPGRTALAVEDLTRILINLVRNAADAMPSGGTIRLTARYADGLGLVEAAPPPRGVVLTITDSGPGIPEALRDLVFDLGFSTRGKESARTGSNWPAPRRRGVGLSIVRNLVEAAEGTVCVTSARGRGACFEITLPFLTEFITSGTCFTPPPNAFPADSHTTGCIECQ